MSEVRLPNSAGLREVIDRYKVKLEAGILPPDPARIAEFALRTFVEVEHVLPVPPILEQVHSGFTRPLVESLPRLPMTNDFHEWEWLKWLKEEFKF